jgi:hypothetical protein
MNLVRIVQILFEICSQQPTAEPITIEELARRMGSGSNKASSSIGELKAASIRKLFKSHLKPYYSEQDCTAIVLNKYQSRARIEVQGNNKDEMFRTSVPLTTLPDRPEIGDKYKLVVWDLWHHWFGITATKKTGSTIPAWTAKQRREFKRELKHIRIGTFTERGVKS